VAQALRNYRGVLQVCARLSQCKYVQEYTVVTHDDLTAPQNIL
jgi:hypothetical protein